MLGNPMNIPPVSIAAAKQALIEQYADPVLRRRASMLWGTRGDLQVSCAMFDLRAGRGFRGFSRSQKSQLTWEMVLREERVTTTANNVVTLGSGKKRK